MPVVAFQSQGVRGLHLLYGEAGSGLPYHHIAICSGSRSVFPHHLLDDRGQCIGYWRLVVTPAGGQVLSAFEPPVLRHISIKSPGDCPRLQSDQYELCS